MKTKNNKYTEQTLKHLHRKPYQLYDNNAIADISISA